MEHKEIVHARTCFFRIHNINIVILADRDSSLISSSSRVHPEISGWGNKKL